MRHWWLSIRVAKCGQPATVRQGGKDREVLPELRSVVICKRALALQPPVVAPCLCLYRLFHKRRGWQRKATQLSRLEFCSSIFPFLCCRNGYSKATFTVLPAIRDSS